MNRKFEFEDTSPQNISFEYDEDIEEKIEVVIENGRPFLYANKQVYMALAKTFIKMAICDYPVGFHIYLHQDFDANLPETLCCSIEE